MHTSEVLFTAIGDLTVDHYVNQKKTLPAGASFNSAVWARSLGARASVMAAVGTDAAGADFRTALKNQGIDQHMVETKTGSSSTIDIIISEDGDRHWGAWNPGVLADYHLSPDGIVYLQRQDVAVLVVYNKTVHLLDEFTAASIQTPEHKPLRVVNFDDLSHFTKSLNIVQSHIHGFDIGFFGLDGNTDANLIQDLDRIADIHNKLFVVTLGKLGSIAIVRGHKRYVQEADPVQAVDTTGAGDAFLAGFTVSLARVPDIQQSLKAGTILASRAIQHVGAY